jgi:hypothetical protein
MRLPPHAQAPSITEVVAGMSPHILSKRPPASARNACHIIHRVGHCHCHRGPCSYRRTATITNHNPSPNDDHCTSPRATTSYRGTVRPARLRPLMVSYAARGMSRCTVENTTSTPRTPSRRNREGEETTMTIPHRRPPHDAIRCLAPQANQRFPRRHHPADPSLQTPDPITRRPSSLRTPYPVAQLHPQH